MFYNQLQELACFSEHAFFSFSNLTSYLACKGNNLKANVRLEKKVMFAQEVQKRNAVQSTLALRTPRYYGHPANTDSCKIPG